ncbi:MAG TPA: hypothetical protein VHN82_08900, partial [Methanoregula sp.]|nr:hypothetical protein [Methanoregula sp.]
MVIPRKIAGKGKLQNPTNPACSHSPYLSSSAFAGNTLLISPELMIRNGFLGDMGTGPVPDFPE